MAFEAISETLEALFVRMSEGKREAAGRLPTADDVLPAVIIVLVRAKQSRICAHLEYVRRYRRPELLPSELSYFIVTVESANAWIGSLQNLEERTPEEFDADHQKSADSERGFRDPATGRG
uniref:VPS9 domain-containing protein n=1 Tax=Florenciella parvula TaxID=236787 RepID=A0A7S2BQ28_9STRA|mmetsp:Transcript_19051/g.39782  ORF Transcript_19051/g.39782 Transcript_19051/m.39782 type:complete len:121 (+) Transcript_19051:99-461(+)